MPCVKSPILHGGHSLENFVGGVPDADSSYPLPTRFAENIFVACE